MKLKVSLAQLSVVKLQLFGLIGTGLYMENQVSGWLENNKKRRLLKKTVIVYKIIIKLESFCMKC